MKIEEESTIRYYLRDDWGNSYPIKNRLGDLFNSIDEVKTWLKENFESYIIKHLKENGKDFGHKVSYPSHYKIIRVTTIYKTITVKPHEIVDLEVDEE